jgi:hypothetical protein
MRGRPPQRLLARKPDTSFHGEGIQTEEQDDRGGDLAPGTTPRKRDRGYATQSSKGVLGLAILDCATSRRSTVMRLCIRNPRISE